MFPNISNYILISESWYIKLTKELNNPMKKLINMQNLENNECFRWCLIRYLNPVGKNPLRISKAHKNYVDELRFKEIKCPVIVKDYANNEEMNTIAINVVIYEINCINLIYNANKKFQKNAEILLITEDCECESENKCECKSKFFQINPIYFD